MYGIQRSASPLVKPHNFMHSDDYLVLEDESGRVKLGGTYLLPSVYVTGLIMRFGYALRRSFIFHFII